MMTLDGRSLRPRRWLPSRLQALVGLTLILAVGFAIAAWRAVRVERFNVSMATCMFAADATRVLEARALSYLDAVTEPVFAAVGGRTPLPDDTPLPGPEA